MLRAVSSIYIESQALAAARRDFFKSLRTTAYAGLSTNQTVLSEASNVKRAPVSTPRPSEPTPPPPPPLPPPRLGWVAAAAIAFTASVGGVYFLRKLNTGEEPSLLTEKKQTNQTETIQEIEESPIPASPESLPKKIDFLVVGAGTAAFAALRALRSLKPDASVLLVGDERALPYMRPPLTKELWREPDLAERIADPDTLIFSQWNGRKRRLAYEPSIFYTPTEQLREGEAGAGVARGWRVSALNVERHEATLTAGGSSTTIVFNKCLIATGSRSVRSEALRAARGAGLSLAARTARDVARLAERVRRAPAGRVVLLGGGAHACELAAALAHALQDSGKTVVQVYKEEWPLADQLPQYLAADVARRLRRLGVTLLPNTEVIDSSVSSDRVQLKLSRTGGEEGRALLDGVGGEVVKSEDSGLEATLVVECLGSEPNTEVAQAAGLEVHPELGGIVVNGEMQVPHGRTCSRRATWRATSSRRWGGGAWSATTTRWRLAAWPAPTWRPQTLRAPTRISPCSGATLAPTLDSRRSV
ncbi:apoptosis-inducing factor 1, mitochondrial-like isoform X3 [Battus philenor]|uniref:apoptosis-inducing factor 1, mitochondrial-like isoform X3 n=1 Tax=Battus philenor TaxID=42288 RepID=UPI0035D11F0F